MSFDWPRFTIQELIDSNVITIQKDGNHGSNYPRASEFGDVGVAFLTAKLLDDAGNIDFAAAPRLSEEKASKFKFGFIEENDVLLSHNATVGRVAVVPNYGEKVLIGTSLTHYRLDTQKLLPQYLAAYFASKDFQNQLAAVMSQTTRNQVPITAQRKLEVVVPSIEVQEKLTNISGSIIQKVSTNTLMNQTLEQMAQAIFKSWFVDFDPVKAKMNGEQPEGMDEATASLFPEKLVESELGLIPEGWKVGDLSDLMDFNPKRTLKKGTVAPYLDMKNMPTSGHLALDIYDREMGSGTKFMNGDSLLARITPCLENGKTAYVDFLEDEQVGWGSTEYIVMRSKSDSYKYFSYYMARFEPFRKFAIQSMTGTSGRQRAQAQTVQTMPFAIPPISILEKFDEFVAPNMQMIKSHGSENRTLAALRDTLLPKLLSGEIELGQAQELAEVE
ncbi:restriction endonuclease subunit S [Vibrio alginolyticus]